jgi:hypothetical protein
MCEDFTDFEFPPTTRSLDGGVLYNDGLIRYEDGTVREYTGQPDAYAFRSNADGTTGYSDGSLCHALKEKYGTQFWSPIKSLSCHVVHPFIPPFVDWEKINNL